jgi:hypothetical protein
MKNLYKKSLEVVLFSSILIVAAFILYKAGMSSHNRCKATNSTIEDYRFCMNI